MIRVMKRLLFNRRIHLCLMVLLLYGMSWFITEPSIEEKLIDRFQKFSWAEYELRGSLPGEERRRVEFYLKRYEQSLRSLSSSLFDYRGKEQVQAFFLAKGFLYDAWEDEKGRLSYLLAEVLSHQKYWIEVPHRIEFDYLILGEKWIEPYQEYRYGLKAGRLLSFGGNKIYLHRDILDDRLIWYFESLYLTQPKIPESHYKIKRGYNDAETFFLYLDLKDLCEDVFVKQLFRTKAGARDYFVEQGFHRFLPTLLAMASRMAQDKDLPLHLDERYVRAVLSGLSHYPTYSLFYQVIESASLSDRPLIQKMGQELMGRFEFKFPEKITLERIAQVSQELLQRMEKMEP